MYNGFGLWMVIIAFMGIGAYTDSSPAVVFLAIILYGGLREDIYVNLSRLKEKEKQ